MKKYIDFLQKFRWFIAIGLPVIVSDIPGNREWVTPGVQGWLSPDGDIDALAQAIVHAYDHRNTLPEMGVAARKLAEQRADWDKNFPNLLKAYDLAIRVAKKN
jgi:glycosyltransferase involved in cell wall biosynthesis